MGLGGLGLDWGLGLWLGLRLELDDGLQLQGLGRFVRRGRRDKQRHPRSTAPPAQRRVNLDELTVCGRFGAGRERSNHARAVQGGLQRERGGERCRLGKRSPNQRPSGRRRRGR